MSDDKKPKRQRKPWPPAEAWGAEHDTRTILAISRAWERVPSRRKRLLRAYLIETLNQVDLEERAETGGERS